MRFPAILTMMFAAVFAIAPIFAAVRSMAGPEVRPSVTEVRDLGDGAENIYVNRTCSGEPAVRLPEYYVFGMHDEYGGCDARTYKANSYEEARECAEKSCPGCEIEDINWMNSFSSSTPGYDTRNRYCPSRE